MVFRIIIHYFPIDLNQAVWYNIHIWGYFCMTTKNIEIQNSVGLHARPATYFIQKANSFRSSIWVENSDRRANAKSLLGVLSLGISKGDIITILADGSDEEAAVDALVALILGGFNE